jgi:hypothetical protein
MTVYADYQYLVDWEGDGLYAHEYSDISDLVLNASFQRGTQEGIPFQAGAGAISVKLDNSSGIFSPDDEAGPLYGKVIPFLRIRMIMSVNGTPAYLFTGFLESIDPTVGMPVGISTADLRAFGIIAMLQDAEASLEMVENTSTCWIAGALFTAAGIGAGDFDVDLGQSTVAKYWKKAGSNLMNCVREMEAEELGHLVETPEGKAHLWDRAHYFTDPRSSVVQATYGTGTLNIWKLKRLNSLRGIFNSASAEIKTFNKTALDILLLTITDVPNGQGGKPLIVPAGGSLSILFDFPGAGSPSEYIGVEEWGIVDYQGNSSADGTGTDLTSDLSETTRSELGPRLQVVFHNAAAQDAHLTVLRAHGVATVEGDPLPLISEATADPSGPASITRYGRRSYPYSFNWSTDADDCQAKLDYVVAQYKDPRPRISFEVIGNYDENHLLECQTRREGDRIRVVAGEDFGLMLDEEFIVDAVAHQVGNDRLHVMTLYCTQAPASQLLADGTVRVPNEISPDTLEMPDQLWTVGVALPSVQGSPPDTSIGCILIICGANKWNADIDEAEVRAKWLAAGASVKSVDLRTAGEGGTFADNGTTQIIHTGLFADWQGLRHQFFYGPYEGIWYFAVRLKNAAGWSNWTDGNRNPQYVTDCVDTNVKELVDTGPPDDWDITLRQGVQEGTCVVMATRPKYNGNRIMSVTFQIRDVGAGAWRELDDDLGAAKTLYDGSDTDHIYDPTTGTLTKASGTYDSAVGVGGLLLIDVRQGNFNHMCCVWRPLSADQLDGETITGIQPFPFAFAQTDDGVFTRVRCKIVRTPANWNNYEPAANNDGFQSESGYRSSNFVIGGMVGDLDTDTFLSPPIPIPEGLVIADLEARVWFENLYSVSDDENHETTIVDAASLAIIPVVFEATAHGISPAAPIAGEWKMIRIPSKMFIAGVTVLADVAGDCEWDIRKCTYDAYPAVLGNSIVGATPPALDAVSKYQDFTLSDWTRGLEQGDCLVFFLQPGATGINQVTISIFCSLAVTIGKQTTPGTDAMPKPWAYWPMDEVSTFVVPNAPAIWGGAAGGILTGQYLWVRQTFQLEGDVESLANGDIYGPIYIPPGVDLRAFWKTPLRTVNIGSWEGGGSGTLFYDDSYALANVRVIGYKIYTNSVGGGPVGIKGWQAIYRDSAGVTTYGPVRGTTSGETESQFLLGDNEYITQVKGYRNGDTSFQNKIYQLEFVTNTGSHVYGTAYGTAFTLTIPAAVLSGGYQFAGLYGSYAADPKAIRKVGILYFTDTWTEPTPTPDGVIGWNFYTSEDGLNFSKKNLTGGVILLNEVFTYPEV